MHRKHTLQFSKLKIRLVSVVYLDIDLGKEKRTQTNEFLTEIILPSWSYGKHCYYNHN